jgi:hypothetical protein
MVELTKLVGSEPDRFQSPVRRGIYRPCQSPRSLGLS